MSDHTSKFRLGTDGPEYTVILKDGLRPGQTEPGLYRVTCDRRDGEIIVERATEVSTTYAAVNGIQNNLDRAAFVMLDKVDATADLRRGGQPVEFTLYHVPTRGLKADLALAGAEIAGQTTTDAKRLAAVLENTASSGRPVVWSVHSRGANVFDRAVHDCAKRGVSLSSESVAIYNGAMNQTLMNHDLRTAGVTKVGQGFYNNPYDPVPQIVGDNTRNPLKLAGALYNARTVISSDQSLHTWHVPLTEGAYRSVPVSQWERPGFDLRDGESAYLSAERGGRPGQDGRSASMKQLDSAALARAGIDASDPTHRILWEAIGARRAYEERTPEQQTALLDTCRRAFRRDLSGPDLTGVPLRDAALRYVQGETSADVLLAAALKHSAAIQRGQTLAHAAPVPDLGHAR